MVKKPSNKEIIKEIEADNEKEFLKELKKKQPKDFLIKLDMIERERVAQWIIDRFNEVKVKHNDRSDEIDEYDEVYRMERKQMPGDSGDMPNYRTPLSTTTLEVIHSNYMNTFFTPKDPVNVLPTEQGDVKKIPKLNIFTNWSMKNEMELFTRLDRLFHNSGKIGETPYMVHWVKEYATVIKRDFIMNPANPGEPLVDPDTEMPIFQEKEEQKLIYNGPKLDIFSRKDYYQPLNSMMDRIPDWEMVKIRRTFDWYLREQLQGKMYPDSINDITDWGGGTIENTKVDFEGDNIPVGKWEKEFITFYGRLRVNVIKSIEKNEEKEVEDTQELEDEFIAIVNVEDGVLCSLRKNKFPRKERPIGLDIFLPDDEGRRRGIGVMEFMESLQKSYDALFNQYIYGTMQANNPIVFFQPMGNLKKEPIKLKNGYMYPTSDPKSITTIKLPPPDDSITAMLELVNQWAQLLFGISDFAAGTESKIDPSAPARKAELIVARGNVRMNTIIKRKNRTIKDIARRWFLLYQANIPPNKYMRVAGASKENPFDFPKITIEDFALNSIPDFEVSGNIENSNKALRANKAIAVYQLMFTNPFFSPQTQVGIKALYQLTKWLIDRLDEIGLSSFLPDLPGEIVQTPEEENARFLQGDFGEPSDGEDHVKHIKVHRNLLMDNTVPEEVREKIVIPHIQKTIKKMQEQVTQQIVMGQMGVPMQPGQGGQNAIGAGANTGTPQASAGVLPQQPGVVG